MRSARRFPARLTNVCIMRRQNELPGPGQYHKVPTLVRTTVDSGSVSRLGYSTGFVSKTKRFNDRVRDAVPGPGAYQPPRYCTTPSHITLAVGLMPLFTQSGAQTAEPQVRHEQLRQHGESRASSASMSSSSHSHALNHLRLYSRPA
jgi:hypothetical protein